MPNNYIVMLCISCAIANYKATTLTSNLGAAGSWWPERIMVGVFYFLYLVMCCAVFVVLVQVTVVL
jgi:hypothetical protein